MFQKLLKMSLLKQSLHNFILIYIQKVDKIVSAKNLSGIK